MEKLVYSSSPHIKSNRTTKRVMIDVCIALLPACIVGCVYFGWQAIVTFAIACAACIASEVVFRLCQKVPFKQIWKEFDFTSLVTALLVAMNMYKETPWYVTLLASVFSIVVVKMLFGGTGKNIVNPAMTGRVFAAIAFPTMFTGAMISAAPSVGSIDGGTVTSGATPLGALLNPNTVTSSLSTLDLLLGTGVGGAIGETCKLALIAGGIYLVARKVLNFRWPLVYMGVVGVFSMLLHWAINGEFVVSVLWDSILSGGVVLGAVFMATDFVTTPNTKLGNYIYFVALGLLTAGLRYACGTEVVSYCILLMNFVVPLIDKFVVNKPFGWQKPEKSAETAKEGK
ncbi:MAG: RnfABCDGE type electron transport complex subunit D [Corallococcus sp.]|nr:RnfABCDGE type electron transport complex subunit D [Corallococcus sp.]